MNPFQSNVSIYIETYLSTYTVNQMTGSYMKCKIGVK